MGYETLGLVFYEIIVPAGHNLEAWNPHIKVRYMSYRVDHWTLFQIYVEL